jgi:ubiquinone/menaquinone biosynthesis C-methylase UbiE
MPGHAARNRVDPVIGTRCGTGSGMVNFLLMSQAASTPYVMGHDERERRRLALQASILNPFTEQLLRRAGVVAGMRVLDLGCGVGEVSIMVAQLVGRHGQVTAIDIDEPALEIARAKAQEKGLNNIEFVNSEVSSYRAERLFDAVVGRHILIHTDDALRFMKTVLSILNPGGIAVFQEYDFSVLHAAYPESPLRDQAMKVFRDFFGKLGRANVGTQLFHLLIEAGFSAPDCRVEYPIDGGADSPFYEWTAESLRSILPRVKALDLVHDSLGDIDTLAQRLREETASLRSCFPAPMMVGGFARRP